MAAAAGRLAMAVAAVAVVAGCGAVDSSSTMANSAPSGVGPRVSTRPTGSEPTPTSLPTGLVGPGCAAFVDGLPDGAASVAAMAGEPLVTALAADPSLTSVVAAVSGVLNESVDLSAPLDRAEFTVFAPVDSAFARIGPRTLARLKTDRAFLTRVMGYHLVPGRLSAAALVGRHPTLEGSELTVAGTPGRLTVNGAHILCGGIRTARSVVYLIDASLEPPGLAGPLTH